jgi:hypothetical protein
MYKQHVKKHTPKTMLTTKHLSLAFTEKYFDLVHQSLKLNENAQEV